MQKGSKSDEYEEIRKVLTQFQSGYTNRDIEKIKSLDLLQNRKLPLLTGYYHLHIINALRISENIFYRFA